MSKSGSIPEWNFLKINIAADWFNSRMEFKRSSLQGRPKQVLLNVFRSSSVHPVRIENYGKRKGGVPDVYIRKRRVDLGQNRGFSSQNCGSIPEWN